MDVISSQLWKQLLNDFINRCKYYSYLNPSLNDIANILSTLPLPTSGKPVRPSLYNNMVTACKELIQTLGKESPSGLRIVTSGDTVLASDINALIDCLNLVPLPYVIYLFNTNDWNTAKNYVTGNSFIFVNYDINTLTNTEVSDLVSRLPILFVNMIDTQPYHKLPSPAFNQVFYNTLVPQSCGYNPWEIIDPCFKQFLGSSESPWADYDVYDSYKVSGITPWCVSHPSIGRLIHCNHAYKKYENGFIIEIPYDGFWVSVSIMEKHIQAMSKCLLDIDKPIRILYLGGYTSDNTSIHSCFPIDNCWNQYALMNGYQLVDLR